MQKGIDVSIHNGQIDWERISRAGIKFAICRSTYGRNGQDTTFQENVSNAHAAGLICGAYHYSYALTPKQAEQEAENCKKYIANAGVLLELPVFFDIEDADEYKKRNNFDFSKQNITEICKIFVNKIKPLNSGIYASYSWLVDFIDWKSLNCPIWSAQWANNDDFKGYMWQFTDKLRIGKQIFDGNILY